MRTYYWNAAQNDNPLKTPFLGQFVLTDANILIPDETLISLDQEVSHLEAAVPGDVRSQLISRNELLTSFAISKAEKTNKLTIDEMRQIRAANSGGGGPVIYCLLYAIHDDLLILRYDKCAHLSRSFPTFF